jgi:MSHA pilin protein MshD
MSDRSRHQRGMTLIEVTIAIVVIAIAAGAVLGVLSATSAHSADAMVMSQGAAIATAYSEEIALKAFADPDGVDGEAARADFDDVDDYDGLTDAGAVDQFGNAIAGLGGYTVSVAVNPSAALPGVPAGDALRIDVRVRFAPYLDYTLTSYRTRL